MSFIDKVKITAEAGRGGDGRRSFRRERFISQGGPDGGDGGNGGDVILKASEHVNTLAAFRYKKQLIAKSGQPGGKSRKHGRSGISLTTDVPLGTEIRNDQGQVIADLVTPGQEVIVARGGSGGFGNAHFTSSTRQAPNFAEKGESGEKLELNLELKLIADVGLVGLPNAGKSTLLSRLTNARPEIADYPFTTLSPNLGVVDIDKTTSLLLADIPGLIEGASGGKGLGHDFLRHISRTRLIVQLIDIYDEDIKKSYQVVRDELAAYSKNLAKLPAIVVVNKIDGYDPKQLEVKLAELKSVVSKKTDLITISAQAGTNLKELKFALKHHLENIKPAKKAKDSKALPRITLTDNAEDFKVIKLTDGYRVTGQKIEKFAARTDPNNAEAVDRLKFILKRLGILHELSRKGLKADERVYFGSDNTTSFLF